MRRARSGREARRGTGGFIDSPSKISPSVKPMAATMAPAPEQSPVAFMEEQSKLTERILDQVADAVICANRSGTIIRWNHASAALFGYSAEEALGQSIELIIPEHLRAAHWSGFNAAMKNGAMKLQGRLTLTRALHKSGRRLYVEMTFAIVRGDRDTEALGAVAVARDVTERVERERAASRSA
jgi:PAS domain S-box-containing protein